MQLNSELMNFLNESRTKGYVLSCDLEKHLSRDSDFYEEFIGLLQTSDIDYIDLNPSLVRNKEDEDFLDDLYNDNSFMKLNEEVNNEVKESGEVSDKLDFDFTDDPIKLYFRELRSIPLLTSDEEKFFSRRIQLGLSAEEALKKIESENKTINPNDLEKINNCILDGEDACDQLVESNLRLVISIAKKFTKMGLDFEDLVQEGNMGLIKAAKKFDYRLGFRFSTYATWWIRQAIYRALNDKSRTVRLPSHISETLHKYFKTIKQLFVEYGVKPTLKEVAEAMGVTEDEVRYYHEIAKTPVSLHKMIGKDTELEHVVPDLKTMNAFENLVKIEREEAIDEALRKLDPRAEYIIRMRFGFIDGKSRTLDEIGEDLNLSRERIRQIERKALDVLRNTSSLVNILKAS